MQAWKAFYADRWQPTEPKAEPVQDPQEQSLTWQAHYGRKMRIQRVFGGRARQDSFFGHKGGIKCLGLLPGQNLMATGERLDQILSAARTRLRSSWKVPIRVRFPAAYVRHLG